jgi:hypothetical protein
MVCQIKDLVLFDSMYLIWNQNGLCGGGPTGLFVSTSCFFCVVFFMLGSFAAGFLFF